MSHPFTVLDVFTDQAFGGNRLAIVEDADDLDDATMQAIAAEFGFPETLFVRAPEDPANDLCARIFTPVLEVPFAGHPNVGLGVWAILAGVVRGAPVGAQLRAEERAGLVVLDLAREEGRPTATLTAPAPFALGGEVPVARAAAAARLPAQAVRTDRHAPVHASVGMGFALVELVDRDALDAARPAPEAFNPGEGPDGLRQAAFYVRDGAVTRMRMFAPPAGVPEDPATGSAAGALAGLTAHLEPAADASVRLVITQGEAMGRPSLIHASAEKRAGVVGPVRVGGSAVRVMTGALAI